MLNVGLNIALDIELNEYFFFGKDSDCALCHGDLWNNNVFLNDKECVLIDWQCVSAGCAVGDIATLVVIGIDIGPDPLKRFEFLVQYYLDCLVKCCGDNSALKEMVEQRIVPLLSSDKMRRKSLQFAVKWVIGSWDVVVKAPNDIVSRILRNAMRILAEMSD